MMVQSFRYEERFMLVIFSCWATTTAGRTCENKTYEVEPRTNQLQFQRY